MLTKQVLAIFLWIILTGVLGVKNLMGEPDYRQVRLYWETDSKFLPKNGYNIRYCELRSWGVQRCKIESVDAPGSVNQGKLSVDENLVPYSTDIKGLRMATTYSFEIKAVKNDKEREDRSEGNDRNENMIIIPTKGFSAKATQCLPQASEIEVSTGPYFGGRIAVEAGDGERCAIDGDPKSSIDIYTLRINHDECGSQVNDTTVATFVLVQENLPILTHSSRRFLVLCSYQPDTLTVRAGITLPTGLQHNGLVYIQPATIPLEDEEIDYQNTLGRRSRNLRTARLMQKAEASVKEEDQNGSNKLSNASNHHRNVVPIFVIPMLVIAGAIGLVAIVLKIDRKISLNDLDNVSIASDVSASSCGTVICDTEEMQATHAKNDL